MTLTIKFNRIPIFSSFLIIKQAKNTKNGARVLKIALKRPKLASYLNKKHMKIRD